MKVELIYQGKVLSSSSFGGVAPPFAAMDHLKFEGQLYVVMAKEWDLQMDKPVLLRVYLITAV